MTNRTDEIISEVMSRTHIWDAFDQGRWAHSTAVPINENPHCDWHINASEWRRGWQQEAAREEGRP